MAENHDIDEDTRALIGQLCTRAGMFMEDASVELLVRAASLSDLKSKVERSRCVVRCMDELLGAAGTLLTNEADS